MKIIKSKNEFSDIIDLIIVNIILFIPFIMLMIISEMNVIRILFIEIVFYIVVSIIIKIIYIKAKIKPTFNQKYYRNIPQIKPAILFFYLNNNKYYINYDFYATILDLINREFLILNRNFENTSYIIKINKEKDLSELKNFEKNIIELLFFKNNKTEVIFSELKKQVEEDELFQERIYAWKMLVEIEAKKEKYLIKNKKIELIKKVCSYLLIISILLGYILLVFSKSISKSLYIFIVGAAIVSYKFMMMNDSVFKQEIVDEIEKSKSLKRYMKDYSLIKEKEFMQIKLWEGFLVYATALDTPKSIKKYFNEIFS